MKSLGSLYTTAYSLTAAFFIVTLICGVSLFFNYGRDNVAEQLLYKTTAGFERTFRGVNETFLTEGTPDSIEIITTGEKMVDGALLEFKKVNDDDISELYLNQEIFPLWNDIKHELQDFKRTNKVFADDQQLLLRYGRLLVHSEKFKTHFDKLKTFRFDEKSKDEKLFLSISISFVLFSALLWIYIFKFIKTNIVSPSSELQKQIRSLSDCHDFNSLHAHLEKHRESLSETKNISVVTEISELGSAFYSLYQRLHDQIEQRIFYEQKLKDESVKLTHMATHDTLTGLPNRALFLDTLERTTHRAKREFKQFAICMLDLDDFKPINDSYGHKAGDLVLKEIAQRMKKILRSSDMMARIGGDEFVFIMELSQDRHQAINAIQRIVSCFENTFDINSHAVSISCCIGVALYPNHSKDPQALMHMADMAMYQAKTSNDQQIVFHSSNTVNTNDGSGTAHLETQ
ncbi:MAG: GGDEF domain-containing protein [Motiliproteus sp.]